MSNQLIRLRSFNGEKRNNVVKANKPRYRYLQRIHHSNFNYCDVLHCNRKIQILDSNANVCKQYCAIFRPFKTHENKGEFGL